MNQSPMTVAHQIADAASACEEQRTGHRPTTATVILTDDTLSITLRGALAPADKAARQTAEQAARFRDYHRCLLAQSMDRVRHEIKRITGVEVREATAEIQIISRAVHLYATGTIVQLFLLARTLASDHWSGSVGERSWELMKQER